MSFEAIQPEPIFVDHKKIADFAIMRLWRNGPDGLRKSLSARDIIELTRFEWLSTTMRLVAQLSDARAELRGNEIFQPTQQAFYLGELLAMDVADSISLELGTHRLDYRPFISQDERISESFTLPEFYEVEDARQALSEAILRKGMDEIERTEKPYQELFEIVNLHDEPNADIRAFPAGFGTMFSKAYRALAAISYMQAESTARMLFPTASGFDTELAQLLDGDEKE